MPNKTAVFFDVGGVLLTNGWDHNSRKAAVEKFNLDWTEFETEHEKYSAALDAGMISVNSYLDKVIFTKPRDFFKTDFYDFMKAQSIPNEGSIAIATRLAAQKKYLMATLNNESTDLNLFRIERFGLGSIFQVFLSSCFLGVSKPDPAIYIRALLVTNKRSEETVFIDDREANLDVPKQLGMSVIHFQTPEQLAADLQNLGIDCNDRREH